MLAFPMGHFGPSLALTARLAPTIIAVVLRGTIARPTKAITILFAIAPLIPSVVILILMPSVVVLVMLSSLPSIFTVFLFSFFFLSLLLLFPLFLLSIPLLFLLACTFLAPHALLLLALVAAAFLLGLPRSVMSRLPFLAAPE